jgi:hypothetical protein
MLYQVSYACKIEMIGRGKWEPAPRFNEGSSGIKCSDVSVRLRTGFCPAEETNLSSPIRGAIQAQKHMLCGALKRFDTLVPVYLAGVLT